MKGLDLEEWHGLLAIELCKSVMKHDPNKSKLSTYYYMRCNSLVNKEYQKTQYKKRLNNGMYSLDELISIDNGVDGEYDTESSDELLISMLNSEYGEVIKLKYEGYTQHEIADMLELSQSQVSRMIRKAREEYNYG